jgi:glycosyltransferase involved in cell wall biosynthesis
LEIPHQPEPGRILTVGGLDDRKGMDTIIRAFARIKMPNARLCMVGGGICADELRALANQLGVADRVDFTGPAQTDRVMVELARASVFVIGSRMDTSPNVVTEAHAAGLPVVGTRAGGIPELIDDGID